MIWMKESIRYCEVLYNKCFLNLVERAVWDLRHRENSAVAVSLVLKRAVARLRRCSSVQLHTARLESEHWTSPSSFRKNGYVSTAENKSIHLLFLVLAIFHDSCTESNQNKKNVINRVFTTSLLQYWIQVFAAKTKDKRQKDFALGVGDVN